jgi:hypothetical protein
LLALIFEGGKKQQQCSDMKYNKIKDKKYYIVGTVKTNPIESVGRQNRYP